MDGTQYFKASFALTVRHWGAVTTAIGLALALAALKGTVVAPNWPSAIFSVGLWSSIGLLVWLLVSFAAVAIISVFFAETTTEIRPIKRTELETLLPFYEQLIGAERPALNQIKALYNANKKAILILERRSQRGLATKSVVAGFCSILPVTKEAAGLMGKEQLNGLQMNKQHICTPRQEPYALYIGSIGGKGASAKAQILGYVLGQIDDAEKHGVRCVYTRPVTKDGLRLAKQYGFRSVAGKVSDGELNRIYRLRVPRQGGVPPGGEHPRMQAAKKSNSSRYPN